MGTSFQHAGMALNLLGGKLLVQLAASPHESLVLALGALGRALSLALDAAADETALQLASALGIDSSPSARHAPQAAYQLLPTLAAADPAVDYRTISAVAAHPRLQRRWGSPGSGGPAQTDLIGLPLREDLLAAANAAVRQMTRGAIPDLFDRTLPGDTDIALVAAAAFRGLWSATLPQTMLMPFHEPARVAGASREEIPMMIGTFDDVRLIENAVGTAAFLPYGSGDFALLLAVPSDTHAPRDLIASWFAGSEQLRATLQHTTRTALTVALPPFVAQTTTDFGPALIRAGIVDAFTPQRARLPGFPGTTKPLALVHHHARVVVASHSHAQSLEQPVSRRYPFARTLIADRPFFWAVWSERAGVFVFMGVAQHPQWPTQPTSGL